MNQPKYIQAASTVRAMVEDGTLRPGAPAPSGAALARLTGYSTLTCRRGLRTLIADGVLVPGPSRKARPRVPGTATGNPCGAQSLADAGRRLATALARCRRAAGLKQAQLAVLTGYSVTAVGHAETGRLWQGRDFWEQADKVLGADGELLSRYDSYLAAESPPDIPLEQQKALPAPASHPEPAEPPSAPGSLSVPPGPAVVIIVWTDGSVTTVCSPDMPGPPPGTPPTPARPY